MPPKKRSTTASKAKKKAVVPLPEQDTNISTFDNSTTEESGRPSKRMKTSSGTEEVPDIETTVDKSPKLVSDNPKKSPQPEPAVKLTGNFDLYRMELPFLNEVYAPSGNSSLEPEELYKTILTYQAKPDRTAKIFIPDDYATNGDGTFSSSIVCDPCMESPFDISIRNIKDVAKLKFTSQYGRPDNAWDGPGIEGHMEIDGGRCGITSSSGSIKMTPLWKKVDGDSGKVMELFEGTFTFKVSYSSLYSKSGYGRGQMITRPFWAVRGVI